MLKLLWQLSKEELDQLRLQLDARASNPTWENVNLHDPAARSALFEQEQAKAGKRVKIAFEQLKNQRIVDQEGKLLKTGLPADMHPDSSCDVGG